MSSPAVAEASVQKNRNRHMDAPARRPVGTTSCWHLLHQAYPQLSRALQVPRLVEPLCRSNRIGRICHAP